MKYEISDGPFVRTPKSKGGRPVRSIRKNAALEKGAAFVRNGVPPVAAAEMIYSTYHHEDAAVRTTAERKNQIAYLAKLIRTIEIA